MENRRRWGTCCTSESKFEETVWTSVQQCDAVDMVAEAIWIDEVVVRGWYHFHRQYSARRPRHCSVVGRAKKEGEKEKEEAKGKGRREEGNNQGEEEEADEGETEKSKQRRRKTRGKERRDRKEEEEEEEGEEEKKEEGEEERRLRGEQRLPACVCEPGHAGFRND